MNQLTEPTLREAAMVFRDNPIQTAATSIFLIKSMNEDGDMESEMKFYAKILNEIMHGDIDTISNEEMSLFLVMHSELIKLLKPQ